MADHAFGLPSLAEVAIQEDIEIFAGYSPPPRIEGITVSASVAGVVASGTVMGRITADGKYAPYNNANMDGTEVAVGVLRSMVDATSEDRPGELVLSGVLKDDQLTGLDAAAITDLGGRQDTVRNVFQF